MGEEYPGGGDRGRFKDLGHEKFRVHGAFSNLGLFPFLWQKVVVL